LLQRLDFCLQLDYVHATRYRGGTQGGERVEWIARPRTPLAGRTVLVVDDILDEGHTLAAILADLRERDVAALKSAVLVDKRHSRKAPGLSVDYVGLQLEDRYLFGCGMDYHERHRQYSAVYALAEEDDRR
jgi:hypoxanthine phosphoribosyltransferase